MGEGERTSRVADVDVDHHDPGFVAARHERYAELRRSCPVAWSPRHGGFWLVTGYDEVAAIARDAETFAHTYDPDPPEGGLRLQGICGVPRPRSIPRQGVSELDGPAHADLRRLLNPWFSPAQVQRLRPRAEQLAAELLDAVLPAGRADLVDDLCSPLPAVLTLEMVGLPSDRWRHYADFFHASTSYRPTDPEFRAAAAHVPAMMAELVAFAARRRAEPADDLTSALVACELAGRRLDDAEVGNVLWNLVAGGVDTTTSLAAWALHHLGTHPEHRDRLLADRSLLPTAIEEHLRHVTPNETLTRTVTRDVELGGRQLRRGDVVVVSWVSANHDERAFDRPGEVVLDRAPNPHLAFGGGRHRCIGAHLARMEAEVLLGAVLDRIPDYEVDEAGFRPSPGNVVMTSVVALPVTFTPRAPSGTGRST